jgi:ABC-type thiamine transport system ATPase subunit
MARPTLNDAAREAMRVMAAIIGAKDATADDTPVSLSGTEAMRITAAWGYVHGLAILLIDQRLRGIIKVTPDFEDPLALVDKALDDVRFGFEAQAQL